MNKEQKDKSIESKINEKVVEKLYEAYNPMLVILVVIAIYNFTVGYKYVAVQASIISGALLVSITDANVNYHQYKQTNVNVNKISLIIDVIIALIALFLSLRLIF